MTHSKGRVLHKAAYVYDFLNPLFSFFQINRQNQRAISFLNLEYSDKVLDVGCATGSVCLKIGQKVKTDNGGIAVGIDASTEMISLADKKKKKLPVVFQICSADNINFSDCYFNKAISTFFFHHINYALKINVLNEVYRVLKIGGKFIILDIDKPDNIIGSIVMNFAEYIFKQPEIGENKRGLLKNAIEDSLFKKASLLQKTFGYISYYLLEK